MPLAAGGVADVVPRIIAEKMSARFGHPVIIENRPGAGHTIGADAAAKAPPDGHTVLMTPPGPLVTSQLLYSKLSYYPTAFVPVSILTTGRIVLVANPKVPVANLGELITYAKAQPGRLSVATPGNGSVNQIVLEWMALNTGTKFQHIPYKGGAPAAAALAAGDIPLGILASSSVAPHVKSGRARALAVTMAKRSKFSPEWPTLQEAGVKEVDASNWTALFAPKGTPQPILDKLNAEVENLRSFEREYRSRLKSYFTQQLEALEGPSDSGSGQEPAAPKRLRSILGDDDG